MQLANFFAFWMLTTYTLSKGDVIGLLLSVTGFLIMMGFIEDLEYETNTLFI